MSVFVCTPRCMLLQVFGSCCAKFETGQTLSYMQTDETTSNIVGQQCWEMLRPFTYSLERIDLLFTHENGDFPQSNLKSGWSSHIR